MKMGQLDVWGHFNEGDTVEVKKNAHWFRAQVLWTKGNLMGVRYSHTEVREALKEGEVVRTWTGHSGPKP